MGKNLDVIVKKCKVKAYILESKKSAELTIDIENKPTQKVWLGKKVGDTYKIPNLNITYRIDAIEDFSTEVTSPFPSLTQVKRKVFWVFQNDSFPEEASDEYLFAAYNGPHHWERLREVRQENLIIHSYHAMVVAVSVAKGPAQSWTRGDGLLGRRIECEYHLLKKPISTSARSQQNIMCCAGSEYQPFNVNGKGNMGYFFDMTPKLRDYYISEIIKYNPYIVDEIPELKKYQTP